MMELAKIQAILKCELDPYNPGPEICAIIDAMIANNQMHEESILMGVIESAQARLMQLELQKKNGGVVNGTE